MKRWWNEKENGPIDRACKEQRKREQDAEPRNPTQ